MRYPALLTALFLGFFGKVIQINAAEQPTSQEAGTALKKAVQYYRNKVGFQGGYLWRYSADLTRQEGEGKTSRTTAWIQPPGTPSVGEAFLDAFERTNDEYYLDAARETAHALVAGQLKSGGWDNRIEFAPQDRKRYAYRIEGDKAGKRNVTTLDDDKTQSALRFLMRIDQTLRFKDQRIHEAAQYALESLLQAQYPNGAWPQRFSEPPDPDKHPVLKADYPKEWSRIWKSKSYGGYYTFNDNSIADVIDTMFAATEIYGDKRYQASAKKAGDFMILAQMPEPQPGWAQQYDAQMHPAWARKFEPASITGGESQGVMRTLMKLYQRTGKKKYLEPIPRALAYYRRSLLPNGRLARFYELKTNRPLYFVKDTYELTYSSDNMPTHYGFIVSSKLDSIEREYKKLLTSDPGSLNPPRRKPTYRMSRELSAQAKTAIDNLDSNGAWIEEGTLRYHGSQDPTKRIIDARTFLDNTSVLSRYVAASRAE